MDGCGENVGRDGKWRESVKGGRKYSGGDSAIKKIERGREQRRDGKGT